MQAYKACFSHKRALGEDDLKEAFRFFDLDGSGQISASELHSIMQELLEKLPWTEQEFNAIVAKLDGNGDGQISYEEFSTILLSTGSTPSAPKQPQNQPPTTTQPTPSQPTSHKATTLTATPAPTTANTMSNVPEHMLRPDYFMNR